MDRYGSRSWEPLDGGTPTSYRPEAYYGMLAILCFLRRLGEFTGIFEPWEGISIATSIATDSLSLLDTIRGICAEDITKTLEDMPETTRAPLDPMSANWDVVGKLEQLLKEMPTLVLKHVKGHQDRTIQYHRLPLLSQLNVDADRLANDFQCSHGEERSVAPLISGTGVHLVTPQGTVTSKYASAIQYQATYQPLLKYLRTTHTSDQINWPAHSANLKKRPQH